MAEAKVTNFDFMAARRYTAAASISLVLVSIVFFFVNGLNWGLDFTGGTLVELGFEQPVNAEDIRAELTAAGFENGIVQNFGTERDILVRMPPQADADQSTLGDRILETLLATHPEVDLRRSEFVGPAVGEQLRESGGLALLIALGVVMLYIMLRFTGKFAIGAVVALVHDVIIVLGAFAVFHWTFDLPVLAAVLAVIGYSLNDTIVVYDRERENFRRMRRGTALDIINTSVNQVLGRSLVTSGTTVLVLLALLVLGGEIIRGFATALTVGIVVGTYSSIYVASTVLAWLGISREDLQMPEKEGAEDSTP